MSEQPEIPNKSTGPKTPEGKKRSSQNSIRHGLTSASIVLQQEDRPQFEELLADYLDECDPQTNIERDLVHQLATTKWHMQRVGVMETRAIEIAVQRTAEKVDQEYECASNDIRVTLAFQDLADNSHALQLLHRYDTTLNRRYLKLLAEIDRRQANRKAAEEHRRKLEEEQQRRAEELRIASEKEQKEEAAQPQAVAGPNTREVIITLPKSFLRNELPPPARRDIKVQPREDKVA